MQLIRFADTSYGVLSHFVAFCGAYAARSTGKAGSLVLKRTQSEQAGRSTLNRADLKPQKADSRKPIRPHQPEQHGGRVCPPERLTRTGLLGDYETLDMV
jgi:hypothetical protein